MYFFEDEHAEWRYVCRRCQVIGTLGNVPVQLGMPDGVDQMVLARCAGQKALIDRFRRDSVTVSLPDGGVFQFRPLKTP